MHYQDQLYVGTGQDELPGDNTHTSPAWINSWTASPLGGFKSNMMSTSINYLTVSFIVLFPCFDSN